MCWNSNYNILSAISYLPRLAPIEPLLLRLLLEERELPPIEPEERPLPELIEPDERGVLTEREAPAEPMERDTPAEPMERDTPAEPSERETPVEPSERETPVERDTPEEPTERGVSIERPPMRSIEELLPFISIARLFERSTERPSEGRTLMEEFPLERVSGLRGPIFVRPPLS